MPTEWRGRPLDATPPPPSPPPWALGLGPWAWFWELKTKTKTSDNLDNPNPTRTEALPTANGQRPDPTAETRLVLVLGTSTRYW
jgi:hypothetical protein